MPATVFNPPGFPTATVIGQGGSPDVDFYSFTASGGQIYIDIDNDPFTFDTIVSLFNSAGTLLASNDDSGPIDSGSASGTDSFLGVFTLPGPGTYFIAVSEFDNFASATSGCSGSTILLRPDGNFGGQVVTDCQVGNSSFPTNGPEPINGLGYTMHVSVQSPVSLVPEPASLLLVGSGLLLALWRRKRN